jgi:hypothetical protein
MKSRIVLALVAFAAFAFQASNAQAFELLDRMLGRGHSHGCCEVEASCCEEPTCCEAEVSCSVEPSCCEVETSCCEPDPCCGARRRPILNFLKGLFDCNRGCCEESSCCEVEASCCGG